MKKLLLLLLVISLLPFGSCKDGDTTSTPPKVYDPNIPVKVNVFMPDSGGLRSKFIVKGSNFGSDISKIQVLFNENRKATVISSTGDMIYCLVPKQNEGNNSVTVVVGNERVKITDKTFNYTAVEAVSTVCGKPGEGGLVNGSLVEAKLNRVGGVGVLTGNNVILFCPWDNNVRMVSVEDNKVISLHTAFAAVNPAITKDRKTAYAIGWKKPHVIYKFDQNSFWEPSRVCAQLPGIEGDIWSAALDNEEKYLYFRDSKGVFGRLELANTANLEILNPNCGGASNTSYLVYNHKDDHFYLSQQTPQGIWRISKDGAEVEQYAGFNGVGGTNGPKEEASFRNPSGMAVDSEGNLYVVDSGSYIIRKIAAGTGIVSIAAGQYSKQGSLDGKPLESTFDYPYCIAVDQEDNFYIGQSWGCTLRKLAIE